MCDETIGGVGNCNGGTTIIEGGNCSPIKIIGGGGLTIGGTTV